MSIQDIDMSQIYDTPQSDIGYTIRHDQPISAGTLSSVLVGLFLFSLLVDVVSVYGDIHQLQVLLELQHGVQVSEADFEHSDRINILFGGLQLLVYFVTGIVFLIWLHRTYKNLLLLGIQNLKYSAAWAVGYFFIPILNLF